MKKHNPLFWKLYPPFLMVVLIPLVALGWYADYSMRQFFLEQTAAGLEARANLLKDPITALLLSGDVDQIDALSKRAGKMSDMRVTVSTLRVL